MESLARTNHTSKYGADIIVNFDSIWREGGLLVCVVVVIFENPVAVALLMNIAVYIIDNLQVIEVTKMELKQILKDDDHTSNWGKGRGGDLFSNITDLQPLDKKTEGGYSQV